MLSKDREILSFRQVAILPVLLFVPTMLAFVLFPGTKISNVIGIFFHLAALFVVSRMPAPQWAKACGFGWLVLDVLCGAMIMNDVPHAIAWPVRLGGHILAGIWVVTASLLCRYWDLRIVGVVTGLWLAGFTFFATVLPVSLLGPPGVLTCVWFGLLAWHYPVTPRDDLPPL